MILARLYLRASTDEQDATRARASLEAFADDRGLTIVATYVETESGATLARPELFRLLADSRPGDVLLVEQVDRLSRLSPDDWRKLRHEIEARQVRVVSPELPMTWLAPADDFTSRMLGAINAMLLDMLAAIARKDYEDRRRRQAEGIAKAKAEAPERYHGRPENGQRNAAIAGLLGKGLSWSQIEASLAVSRPTIARIARRRREQAAAQLSDR
jgi:DNA invertase Pin-like site-specific DNA recombinase